MKTALSAAALIIASASPSAVFAQAAATRAAPAAASAYSVESTDIGTLLDNPAAKAVVDKYLPGFSSNPQIDMARSMTLKSVQQYSPDTMTDATLARIQTDLARLPAAK